METVEMNCSECGLPINKAYIPLRDKVVCLNCVSSWDISKAKVMVRLNG